MNETSAWRRVLAAEAVSNFGGMLSRLAIPFVATLQLGATPAGLAGLLVADVLAAALGGLALAGWIDRRGKRLVMLLADAARAIVLALLALGAAQGWLTMPMLVLAAAVTGLAGAAFEIARSAWMAQQLEPATLVRRNAQLASATSLAETAAFALGGWLYQALGAVVALLVDALSYVASGLCLRRVPPSAAAPVVAEAPAAWRLAWHDIRAGWQGVRADATLRALLALELMLGGVMALTGSAYMVHVARDVGLATGPIGMIAATGAIGALVGAQLAARLGDRLGAGRTMALGLAALALGAACIPMASHAGVLAIAWLVLHQVVGDAGHTLHAVHERTLRQTLVAEQDLARVDATLRAAGQLALLLGAGAVALLADAISARALLVAAALLAAAAATFAALRLSAVRVPA